MAVSMGGQHSVPSAQWWGRHADASRQPVLFPHAGGKGGWGNALLGLGFDFGIEVEAGNFFILPIGWTIHPHGNMGCVILDASFRTRVKIDYLKQEDGSSGQVTIVPRYQVVLSLLSGFGGSVFP